MARNLHGTHSDLIHCDNCGEDYSSTYKRCPFCGARPASTQATGRLDSTGRIGGVIVGARAASSRPVRDDSQGRSRQSAAEDDYVFDGQDVFDDDTDQDRSASPFRASGGRHLAGGILDISPATLIGFVTSAVIVIAAILIVIFVVIPMIKGGKTPAVSNKPNDSLPGNSQSLSPSPSDTQPSDDLTSPSQPAQPSDPVTSPSQDPLPTDSVSPSPSTSVPPVTGGLTLSANGRTVNDITISDRWPAPVQLTAGGASGTVTWTSSDSTVATVSANGLVTAVNKGQCVITAIDSAGKSQNCRIISTITLSATAPSQSQAPSQSPAPSQSLAPSQSPTPSQSQAPSGGSLTFSAFGRTVDDISFSNAYPTPVQLRVNGASGTVTWSSSDNSVATVDANGTVSMVSKGQCRVTATDASGKTGSCIVRVN